jgi:DNA repair protein RadC
VIDIRSDGTLVPNTHVAEQRIDYGETEGFREPGEVVAVLRKLFDVSSFYQETFVVVAVDSANHPIRVSVPTIGLADSNQVHPREIFAPVLVAQGTGVFLIHNHPSGTLDPSPEDRAITKRLKKSGELLGIRVLDHIIVTREGFFSFRTSGIL